MDFAHCRLLEGKTANDQSTLDSDKMNFGGENQAAAAQPREGAQSPSLARQ